MSLVCYLIWQKNPFTEELFGIRIWSTTRKRSLASRQSHIIWLTMRSCRTKWQSSLVVFIVLALFLDEYEWITPWLRLLMSPIGNFCHRQYQPCIYRSIIWSNNLLQVEFTSSTFRVSLFFKIMITFSHFVFRNAYE